MHTSDFFYDLPDELIAQTPAIDRASSRLLVFNRGDNTLTDRTFSDILAYLRPGDVLVRNTTRVIPARLFGKRSDTGKHCRGHHLLLYAGKRDGRNRLGASPGSGWTQKSAVHPNAAEYTTAWQVAPTRVFVIHPARWHPWDIPGVRPAHEGDPKPVRKTDRPWRGCRSSSFFARIRRTSARPRAQGAGWL